MADVEELDAEWTPLSQRPELQDLQPMYLDEGKAVALQYTARQLEIYAYFRAIKAAGEVSQRAMGLTAEVIGVNSADYTAWEYRWRCLQALGTARGEELAFMQAIADVNPKNYQLWNHRRKFALLHGAPHAHQELQFAAECLERDAKNYHAWAHRQAVVKAFGLWAAELAYVGELLRADVRNNSAWNQRFVVVAEAPDMGPMRERYQREVTYAAVAIRSCPHNESAWGYLRGLFKLPGMAAEEAYDARIPELCAEVLQTTPSCRPALATLAAVYTAQSAAAEEPEIAERAAAHAGHMLRQLQVADPLRHRYWAFRERDLEAALAEA